MLIGFVGMIIAVCNIARTNVFRTDPRQVLYPKATDMDVPEPGATFEF